ncbi:MAG TPA: NAD-dependent succinate-semialdehyde dehydrogenase [Devosia sp.]
MNPTYPNTQLYIEGQWRNGALGRSALVLNPASGAQIGSVALSDPEDLERAVQAGKKAFEIWRRTSAFDRAVILRRSADLLRVRMDAIAPLITLEQGKPLQESRAEVLFAAEVTDWFSDEGRRTYGRLIPSRAADVSASVVMEPLGLIAGFTPWNYPLGQAIRKIAIALAAGCSIIVKVAEETPAAAAAMLEVFTDAGLPPSTLQLVFGDPAQVSSYLIAHPDVRGISFTGSTQVGRKLTALAGQHLKRCVMELGGHAPAIVFADADIKSAAGALAADKFHNAGQACISPTRLLVENSSYDEFIERFVAHAEAIRLGDGFDPQTTMGPLANERRVTTLTALVDDAVARGARLVTGGPTNQNSGYFFNATVLADVPAEARIMNEEPFGPVAIINRFSAPSEAIAEANRLPYALAAYGWSRNAEHIDLMRRDIRSGMLSINHNGLGLPEVPFGGILDSGFGDEGGVEALREMMFSRFVSVRSPQ